MEMIGYLIGFAAICAIAIGLGYWLKGPFARLRRYLDDLSHLGRR